MLTAWSPTLCRGEIGFLLTTSLRVDVGGLSEGSHPGSAFCLLVMPNFGIVESVAGALGRITLYCCDGLGVGALSATIEVGGWGSIEEQHLCRFYSPASPAS